MWPALLERALPNIIKIFPLRASQDMISDFKNEAMDCVKNYTPLKSL